MDLSNVSGYIRAPFNFLTNGLKFILKNLPSIIIIMVTLVIIYFIIKFFRWWVAPEDDEPNPEDYEVKIIKPGEKYDRQENRFEKI